MKIITSGAAYVDIDAYAGCIAYAELLNLQGVKAKAISTAPLNESISKTVRSWKTPLHNEYTSSSNDTFALIDLSDPAHFDTFVDLERVDEVIDHHPGFEQYWHNRIGDKADIEFIGAACTLIFERWKAAGLLEKMSITSAQLLICAILDNTLNFGAKVTTQRDIDAYNTLIAQAELPADWTAQYFTECQKAILEDIVSAIGNDKKVLTFNSYAQPICFGQLVAWDAQQVLVKHNKTIGKTLSAVKPDWFMNLISVSEGKSYFISDNKAVQAWLSDLLGIKFDGSVAIAERLWLRKEVIKQNITASALL